MFHEAAFDCWKLLNLFTSIDNASFQDILLLDRAVIVAFESA